MTVVIHHNPDCGTSRNVLAIVEASGEIPVVASLIEWPPHLTAKYGDPKANPAESLVDLFAWAKGGWSVADFLAQCSVDEIPQFLRNACITLKDLCDPQPLVGKAFDAEVQADAL